MNCINFKDPNVIELAKELGIKPAIAGVKIAIWQEQNKTFDKLPTASQIAFGKEINYTFKAVENIGNNLEKVNSWFKQMKSGDFWTKIQKDLQIPKDQIELLKEVEGSTIEEKLVNFAAKYSFSVESNVTTTPQNYDTIEGVQTVFMLDGVQYFKDDFEGTIRNNEGGSWKNISKEEYMKAREKSSKLTQNPTQHYSHLIVPGGTNYTENEISTPLITPSIKGHAAFATDKGIGWFRSDEQVTNGQVYQQEEDDYGPAILETYDGTPTKTRRILEVQSDLFQKGRDKSDLIKIPKSSYLKNLPDTFKNESYTLTKENGKYYKLDKYTEQKSEVSFDYYSAAYYNEIVNNIKDSGNDFLQLLNKDGNWITFFIKSIIQDSAKQTVMEVSDKDVENKIEELKKLGELTIEC